MQYALNPDRIRVEATPEARGQAHICPCCSEPVITKCGQIVIWHWAHQKGTDCDPWWEPEGQWHRAWKNALGSPERQEVSIGNHRADVVGSDGVVIELQNSTVSPDIIQRREQHYGRMIWLFNYRAQAYNLNCRQQGNYVSFRWKWPRKSIWACRVPVFLDLGNRQLLELKKVYTAVPCGGWGYLRTYEEFIRRFGDHSPLPMQRTTLPSEDDLSTFFKQGQKTAVEQEHRTFDGSPPRPKTIRKTIPEPVAELAELGEAVEQAIRAWD